MVPILEITILEIFENFGINSRDRQRNNQLQFDCKSDQLRIVKLFLRVQKLKTISTHANMRPLATAQRIFSWFCIGPFDEPSTGKEIARVVFVVFLPISVVSCKVSSVLFFFKYISTDLNGSIFALLQIAMYFGLIYTMVAVASSRRELLAIFDSLSKIYDACKNRPVHFFDESY